MIDSSEYIGAVKSLFSFLETEFGMKQTSEKVNGNAFYDVEYSDEKKVVSISYENIEDHLEVLVFIMQKGSMPSYDDKTHTLHLENLNKVAMSKATNNDFTSNSETFSGFIPKNEMERKLLKKARELRLCLRHVDQLRVG